MSIVSKPLANAKDSQVRTGPVIRKVIEVTKPIITMGMTSDCIIEGTHFLSQLSNCFTSHAAKIIGNIE